MPKRIYITDKEVAAACEVSQKTLSRLVNGFYRGKHRKNTDSYRIVDLLKAKPETIGGYRRWKLIKVASVLGVTPEELEKRIS